MFMKLKITKLCGTVQQRCLQLQYTFSHYQPPLIETLIYSKCEKNHHHQAKTLIHPSK